MNTDVVESTRDTLVSSRDGSIETLEIEKCWCCGYHSDDLSRVVLENSLRKKDEHVICGLCFEAPYVLDAYLNPWLYENNSRELLATMTFLANRVIEVTRKEKSNER